MSFVFVGLFAAACVPPQGGWDIEGLVAAEPALAAFSGHRLGDMHPFPAFEGSRIALVVCRYPGDRALRIRGGGPGWAGDWAELAVQALSRTIGGFQLVLESGRSDDPISGPSRPTLADIEVISIAAADGVGPVGLGDTLSECDIARDKVTGDYRGQMIASEIRIRRARLDMMAESREATAEEWIAALMHEIAHALGFAGHAAAGDSILVHDQTKLRRAGQRVLAGKPLAADATLQALYQLRPGRPLGTRLLDPANRNESAALQKLLSHRARFGPTLSSTYSSAGDSEARIVWRYADGSRLTVHFPRWQSDLRNGGTITLVPDLETRELLSATIGQGDAIR